MTTSSSQRLKTAISSIKNGDLLQARNLILEEIRENPSNLNAWLWALEVASTNKEKRAILKKILTLDPTHKGALQYLKQLDEHPSDKQKLFSHQLPEKSPVDLAEKNDKTSRSGGALKIFSGWAFTLPPSCGFIVLFALIVSVAFLIIQGNTSLFGLIGNDFDDLAISNSYEKISSPDMYWDLQFEGIGESKFIGTVRHVSPIRISEFRILTHDILVTTVDFADPALVDTTVIDHKFFWKSATVSSPNGSINLIHAVPANKAVYQELLKIQNGDIVKITGREIYTVKAYQADESFLGTWIDTGCNTLLIESVSLIKAQDQE